DFPPGIPATRRILDRLVWHATDLPMSARNRAMFPGLLVLALSALTAHADMLCLPKKAKGSLQVFPQCKKKQMEGDPSPLGLVGPTGVQGDLGAAGPTGAQGPTGTTGPTGARGPTGVTGIVGPIGNPGISAYEIVTSSQNVFVANSGTPSGL